MASIWVKNSLRNATEAASGGKVTVLFDNNDNPCYMVRFSVKTNKDLYRHFFDSDAAWNACPFKAIENEPHPAFMNGGVRVRELLIGQYAASELSGRACSLPGVDPRVSINFDASSSLCKNKGAGWSLNTIWNWGFLQALCLLLKHQPRGNTAYGRSHEIPWETALRVDGGIVGDTTGTPRTKTGTGPISWAHDGTESGIYDLVGNIWEWVTGMKLEDGKILLVPDNNINLAESGWLDTGARYDSTEGTTDGTGNGEGEGDVGDPVLSDEITKYTGEPGSDAYGKEAIIGGEAGFRSLTKKTGFNVPVALVQAGLAPVTLVGGSFEEGHAVKGGIWVRNYGTRFPFVGGDWNHGPSSGLGALYLIHSRSRVSWAVSLRPAFLLV